MGFFAPPAIYLGLVALHLLVPARQVDGYVADASTGRPLRYRLNGLRVLLVTFVLAGLAVHLGWVPWDWLWQQRWASFAGAACAGLVFTLALVLGAPPGGRGRLADLYLGRRANPRLGGVDLKMLLYQLGATMLALNLASFVGHQVMISPSRPSLGVLLYAALLAWFVLEYLWFEPVHLYTYDIFAERVGFKLGWGCLAFYPYFYLVGLWSVADLPLPDPPRALWVAGAGLFVAGWTLARGANLQKYQFKRAPAQPFLGIVPEALRDERHALLCSGFWGVARHVNYLGEIAMATGLTLCLGVPAQLGPWLYPLYYVALLLPRQRDDDRRCAGKYGELWQAYCRKVRWRIVPRVY